VTLVVPLLRVGRSSPPYGMRINGQLSRVGCSAIGSLYARDRFGADADGKPAKAPADAY
jgi:hypothetical protein